MKRILLAVLAVSTLLAGVVYSEQTTLSTHVFTDTVAKTAAFNPGGIGGLKSLRGSAELEETRPADPMKHYPKDQGLIDSDYVYQPPLIPHTIRNYEVSLNANRCLACHSWKNAKAMGATKISVTHYISPRQGQVLSDVSPSRYFCQQCHIPQADAKPLVENDFKRVDALKATLE
ncbi:nitrate reductase cytochrome c-type subunit [Vibrio sagamiensis]|uniref:Periplasmic nitrate reductase, electron transfer subunit n=1 Tax=Vibrio sagamiensis NBRC 104589 TaxID=1219064 RepID=A0A511QG94_9VIBR|nr:nitrate reductase cytochrome c-type subunit [Vibrio sagamiensis]PNQ56762.1 nitrate reductase cytochrome c-type subunit; periplasmic nitrate reductase electron transfer subunit [Vibrio agarivorans]GEM76176.1 periplasmic nitrate reductase cytochrome c-type protein [Vibrio sagamiensis NBRC 104589]